jgi:hypothetical protein
MNKLRFWNLIETAAKEAEGDIAEQARLLSERLATMSAEEIVQFQRLLDEQMALAYRWDLRGAAHLIHSGISDKAFESFRAWLIAHGKGIYEEAVDDPDSIVAIVEEETNGQPLLKAAAQAYKTKTGKPLPPSEPIDTEPAGEEWTEEELPEMFPGLWEQFGEEEREQ